MCVCGGGGLQLWRRLLPFEVNRLLFVVLTVGVGLPASLPTSLGLCDLVLLWHSSLVWDCIAYWTTLVWNGRESYDALVDPLG